MTSAPDDRVSVPREPDDAMYGAGGVEQFKADMACLPVREALRAVYQAMLAAAPPPPVADGRKEDLIVRSVNALPDLVAALEEAQSLILRLDEMGFVDPANSTNKRINAALAKARP